MKTFDVVLTGFGNVGRTFAGLLSEKTRLLEDRYDLSPRLALVYQNNVHRTVSGADISLQTSNDWGSSWTAP